MTCIGVGLRPVLRWLWPTSELSSGTQTAHPKRESFNETIDDQVEEERCHHETSLAARLESGSIPEASDTQSFAAAF
jgi:hypothetical protein